METKVYFVIVSFVDMTHGGFPMGDLFGISDKVTTDIGVAEKRFKRAVKLVSDMSYLDVKKHVESLDCVSINLYCCSVDEIKFKSLFGFGIKRTSWVSVSEFCDYVLPEIKSAVFEFNC